MVSLSLLESLAQFSSGLFDVGEIDRPVWLAGGTNGQKACASICGEREITGRVEKFLLYSFTEHLAKPGLMKGSPSFANPFYSRFIDVYSYCSDAVRRKGCGGAEPNVAHSDNGNR